jgi:hypothetical protein
MEKKFSKNLRIEKIEGQKILYYQDKKYMVIKNNSNMVEIFLPDEQQISLSKNQSWYEYVNQIYSYQQLIQFSNFYTQKRKKEILEELNCEKELMKKFFFDK